MRRSQKLLGFIATSTLMFFSCSGDNSTGPKQPSVPVVATADISAIAQTTAQCGGSITSDGGASITARGVCWSTDATPTILDDSTNDGTGTGDYSSLLTGLTEGTQYYVRAYAANSAGTGYGSTRSFTTKAPAGTVTDIDGNVYQTILIGDQWWMMENLKVVHYRNGDPIQHVTDESEWQGLSTGAYCEYGNNAANVSTYGRLYNWYAVNDGRGVAPEGWHVPTDADWKQLEMHLGMSLVQADGFGNYRGTDEGGRMKESGTTHWQSPNTGATNESEFTALPGGYRPAYSAFSGMYIYALFWTATVYDTNVAYYRSLANDYASVYRGDYTMKGGLSVRCVKD